ncbi:MAG: hypothetical protein ACRD0K_22460 [Egibacteraceae bacterium]
MRYTSPEDARSDLFLSAAVFLLGPLIVDLILGPGGVIPLERIPAVRSVLSIVRPIVFTVLVPYLLIRYRRESVRDYAQGRGGFSSGLLLAAPIVLCAGLASLLESGRLALPVLALSDLGGALLVAPRLVVCVGLVGLAWYATVKARDAFRLDPRTIREGVWEIGRVLAIIAGVATLLLSLPSLSRPSLSFPGLLALMLPPLGVAGAVLLALRRLRGPNSTSRAVLLTPVVLLAITAFSLAALVPSLYTAAMYGGIGLLTGMIHESRQPFPAVLALALAIALMTRIPVPPL